MTTKSNFEKLTKKELIAEINGLVSEVEKLIADNEKDYFKMHKDVSVLRSEAEKQKDIVAELGRKLAMAVEEKLGIELCDTDIEDWKNTINVVRDCEVASE